MAQQDGCDNCKMWQHEKSLWRSEICKAVHLRTHGNGVTVTAVCVRGILMTIINKSTRYA